MLVFTLLPLLVISGFDIGGSIGAALPATGLAPAHTSSARLGVALGWASGRSRLELSYAYTGLPGPQSSPYRLDLGEFALRYAFEFVRQPSWGIAVGAGPGYGFARRSLGPAAESGRSPSAHVGMEIVERQGRSRLSFGFDNALFLSARPAGAVTRLVTCWVAILTVGVSYGF